MAGTATGNRLRDGLQASVRGLALSALSIGVSLGLFIAAVLSISFVMLGVGLLTTPAVLEQVRNQAQLRRRLAREWGGVELPSAYLPFPAEPRPGALGQAERTLWLLRDPATWRDVRWLLADAVAGFATALLAPALVFQGLHGLVLAAGLWEPIVSASGTHWYTFIPVSGTTTATLAGVLGLVLAVVGIAFGPAILRTHWHVCRPLAMSEKQVLTRRVETLAETRNEALDSSAAELRRIERDLHDGAQARLVAMGMSLGAVEALMEKDPEQARLLLTQARRSSAETLEELRDLVRGIHPPVLAERGLGDAVRALALRGHLPVEVTVDLPGRLEEPVESAAYFAVSEVLTNTAKHADAERAWVDLSHDGARDMLLIAAGDDGRGGADLSAGTGLRGIERRLAAFDGVVAVSSPVGGPTRISMEIPSRVTTTDGT
ncbi:MULTISPECIES: sensor histidine kinase [unclassified Streptomyces]|uniref:sensor histidine kinase n=1 Tax=unclassified Streptomyces TaxID=2593676 RepID=UPI000CD57DD4|nr:MULTISPECIES: sensor histidine kinase [unclassified Streptomyces]